jgi:hypothetical protein
MALAFRDGASPSAAHRSNIRECLSPPGSYCRNARHVRSAMRRSPSGSSRSRKSCSSISRNAARSFGGISLKMSSAMPALDGDNALLVCHLMADSGPTLIDAVANGVGITPTRGSGIFQAKNMRRSAQNCWPTHENPARVPWGRARPREPP